MKKIDAVIGANYGDEGKGRTVDFLVSRAGELPLVVRHNSGAQAGHTVVKDDHRHVFSHFGSGTLRGAPTLLGPNFVVNPLVFNVELAELQERGIEPVIMVDHRCRVTSPFDQFLNRAAELRRGDARHGSCGTGFGETIGRYEALGERARTLIDEVATWPLYHDATLNYFLERLLKLHSYRPPEQQLLSLKEGYEKQLRLMTNAIKVVRTEEVLKQFDHLIFEGAQGLELHEEHPSFPHVTRCRTGLEDVTNLLGWALPGEQNVNAYYCTRTYLTRHGAGPLPAEQTRAQMCEHGYEIVDPTNVTNDHQGALRFAELDPNELIDRVSDDLARSSEENFNCRISHAYALTCTDQASGQVNARLLGKLNHVKLLVAYGPSAADTDVTDPSIFPSRRKLSEARV